MIAICGLLLGCTSFRAAELYQSGTQLLEQGRTRAAIVDLEQAAQLLPEASEIQNHLGLAYAESGRSPEALAAFRRAVELDCENEAAQHNLAVAKSAKASLR